MGPGGPFIWVLARLSWRSAQRLGAALGAIWFYLVPVRRRVVLENLQMALPQCYREHRRIARRSMQNTAISVLELLRMSTMSRVDLLSKTDIFGLEHYEQAVLRGRGVIVVTGHFGNFDLLACSQAARGVPLALLSRELSNSGMNRLWMKIRSGFGVSVFLEGRHAKSVVRWLRDGKVIGVVADQRTRPSKGGVLSGFMGHKVWTSTAPSRLALRTGAALVPVWSFRDMDGRHVIRIEPEMRVTEGGGFESNIRQLVDLINKKLESWVVQRPECWMWLHRRFDDIGTPDKRKLESLGQ